MFRTPSFAIAVVTVIALGIGASTAMFSVVKRVLLLRCLSRSRNAWCGFNPDTGPDGRTL